jgi:hypothetical protein
MQRDQTFPENIFYDVSTWTLPLAFDLQTVEHRSDLPEAWLARGGTTAETDASPRNFETAAGVVIDPVHLEAPALVARLLRGGAQVRVAEQPFTIEHDGADEQWPRGSWLVLRATNQARWAQIGEWLAAARHTEGPRLRAIASGLTPTGPDLGSSDNTVIPDPRVVLVVGSGTSSYDAGSLWFFLDQRMRLPVTLIEADRLRGSDLDDATCLVLPGGSYRDWGDSTAEQLERFVEGGGTIVACESAIDWLQRRDLIRREQRSASGETEATAVAAEEVSDARPQFADARRLSALEGVAGAIFQSRLDPTHPLNYGFPDAEVPTFRTSSRPFGLADNPFATAARYAEVLAGYVSQRNRQRLRGTAAVWAVNRGRGRVICLADNPVFRGYFRGPERFLTNAILIGPTLRIPSAPR